MNEVITIKYSGNLYSARKRLDVFGEKVLINLSVLMQQGGLHATCLGDEEQARCWLCDHGLRKSKAKKLLAAALRNEGDFADLNHSARVTEAK